MATIHEHDGLIAIIVAGEDTGLRFRPLVYDTVTLDQARAIVATPSPETLVRFRRASAEAKLCLQAHRVPYASEQGEIFVIDPPAVAIHQPATHSELAPDPEARLQPFAPKASRVSRWLLNHPGERVNVRRLAHETGLSEGGVSQTVRALNDSLLVEVSPDPNDARIRWIDVPAPGRLLDAWQRHWELRRIPEKRWDVGAADAAETLRLVAEAASADSRLRWAVGGLAGAAEVSRSVEPPDVLLWIARGDVPQWEAQLMPTGSGRGRGTLRLVAAPDDYVFDLAGSSDGLRIADPAQLCLDTSREGERALEANHAIRRAMGW